MSVEVRTYRPEEEPRIAELMFALDAEGAGIRPTNAENVARTFVYLRVGPVNGTCGVALTGEGEEARIIGYVLAFPFWSAEYGGLLSLIDEIYVVPEHRGQGVGELLMNHIEAHARAQGHVGLTLLAMNKNSRPHRFYERLGYEPIAGTSFDKLLGD
jgi:GNAT superfamily N-acetyltransferase